jgi:acetoin utilization deacetylase AcuC-like enzyme
MFRIRRILDASTPANLAAIGQAQAILRTQFPGVSPAEIDSLPEMIRNPLRYRFRSILFVAETTRDRVKGVALLLHAPDLAFCFLDYLSAAPGRPGTGIGGILYEQCRDEAVALGATGLFFECLPDDPALSPDPRVRRQNADRLRFYERFGARPIAGTLYETPLWEGLDNPPYLCFDGLGRPEPLSLTRAKPIVRAILERKYYLIVPPGYIDKVVNSFTDDPVRLREPRWTKPDVIATPAPLPVAARPLARRVPLIVNDRHDIHHVRERGYVQAPVRIPSILGAIERLGIFERIEPRSYPEGHIRAVHDGALVDFLHKACAQVAPAQSVYPYVFPIRNPHRPPKSLPLRAGYFCIDTFTPLNANAWLAARRAVDCALTGADTILRGGRLAYALVRPPGHHAERRAFGGFCYFNNAAVAAHYLSRYGRVAVLDIDYHHGNGTQDIFWRRSDVLTVSIHGHPSFAYPYFSGYREERGEGPGSGFNLNLPLPETILPDQYREALATALKRIERFQPTYLVLPVGFDTAAGDPTGSWPNLAADFFRIGQMIAAQGYPMLVVQEGGYRVRTLGQNATQFFAGMWDGITRSEGRLPARPAPQPSTPRPAPAVFWREEAREGDDQAVGALLHASATMDAGEIAARVERLRSVARSTPDSSAMDGDGQDVARRGSEDRGGGFVFGESAHGLLAFAAFAPMPGGRERFVLHAFAVRTLRPEDEIALELLRRVEVASGAGGARRLYAELPARRRTLPLVRFLEGRGFRRAAEMRDYYADGVARLVLVKPLPRRPEPAPVRPQEITVLPDVVAEG